MSVHHQIKQQMTNFIEVERQYKQFDQLREQKIEEVITLAKANKDFSLVEVNAVTEQMKNISKSHGFPLRKLVTKEMVLEFINRK